jgi:hypothetical protein
MRSLVPCSSCNRHVEAESTVCPFCGTSLTPRPDPRPCQGPCAGHAFPRLSRAALATIGATLLCASCLPSGTVEYGTAAIGTGGQTGNDSGQTGGAGGRVDGGAGGAGGRVDGGAGGAGGARK